MKSDVLEGVLYSLAITATISTLVGFCFQQFWVGFALATVIQVVLFRLLKTIYGNYIVTKYESIKAAYTAEQNKQVAVVTCPCSVKNNQAVDIRLDKDVVYKCSGCDKMIKLNVDVKPFITTQPIYFDGPRNDNQDS